MVYQFTLKHTHYIGTLLRCCNDLVETYLRFGKRFYTRINCGFIVEIFTQMRINSIILYTRGDNGSINYRTIGSTWPADHLVNSTVNIIPGLKDCLGINCAPPPYWNNNYAYAYNIEKILRTIIYHDGFTLSSTIMTIVSNRYTEIGSDCSEAPYYYGFISYIIKIYCTLYYRGVPIILFYGRFETRLPTYLIFPIITLHDI